MIPKGVILAAGMGSRLSPITPFVPKEMLPVCGFPAIHHALYELVEVGVTDVMIVVSSDKTALVSYLTEPILPKGADAICFTAKRDELLSRLHITFAWQKTPNGTADAILLAEGFMGDDPVVVLYPDDLLSVDGSFRDGTYATRALIHACDRYQTSAILISEIPGASARDYGIVKIRRDGSTLRVKSLVEKPQDYREAIAYALIGRMILTPCAVQSIRSYDRTDRQGIIPVLSAEAARGSLTAIKYDGRRYDVGSHEGYAFALKELMKDNSRD